MEKSFLMEKIKPMDIKNKASIAHIQRLTQEINRSYQSMGDERRRLAQWEETQEFSPLGEIELLTSTIQGHAGRLLADRIDPSTEIFAQLHGANPFEIKPISDWYITNGEQYPQICHYLELLDYLRLLLVEQLGQPTLQLAA
jgi:hypothetical protein